MKPTPWLKLPTSNPGMFGSCGCSAGLSPRFFRLHGSGKVEYDEDISQLGYAAAASREIIRQLVNFRRAMGANPRRSLCQ